MAGRRATSKNGRGRPQRHLRPPRPLGGVAYEPAPTSSTLAPSQVFWGVRAQVVPEIALPLRPGLTEVAPLIGEALGRTAAARRSGLEKPFGQCHRRLGRPRRTLCTRRCSRPRRAPRRSGTPGSAMPSRRSPDPRVWCVPDGPQAGNDLTAYVSGDAFRSGGRLLALRAGQYASLFVCSIIVARALGPRNGPGTPAGAQPRRNRLGDDLGRARQRRQQDPRPPRGEPRGRCAPPVCCGAPVGRHRDGAHVRRGPAAAGQPVQGASVLSIALGAATVPCLLVTQYSSALLFRIGALSSYGRVVVIAGLLQLALLAATVSIPDLTAQSALVIALVVSASIAAGLAVALARVAGRRVASSAPRELRGAAARAAFSSTPLGGSVPEPEGGPTGGRCDARGHRRGPLLARCHPRRRAVCGLAVDVLRGRRDSDPRARRAGCPLHGRLHPPERRACLPAGDACDRRGVPRHHHHLWRRVGRRCAPVRDPDGRDHRVVRGDPSRNLLVRIGRPRQVAYVSIAGMVTNVAFNLALSQRSASPARRWPPCCPTGWPGRSCWRFSPARPGSECRRASRCRSGTI